MNTTLQAIVYIPTSHYPHQDSENQFLKTFAKQNTKKFVELVKKREFIFTWSNGLAMFSADFSTRIYKRLRITNVCLPSMLPVIASRFERFSFVLAPENCGNPQNGTEKKKRDRFMYKEEMGN